MGYTFYHNPRCSKSRESLKLIQDKGVKAEIIEYLNAPPSAETLSQIGKALQKHPIEWMRTKEARFKELGLSKKDQRSENEWYELMAQNPILIERPILVKDNKAALGRPPENMLQII